MPREHRGEPNQIHVWEYLVRAHAVLELLGLSLVGIIRVKESRNLLLELLGQISCQAPYCECSANSRMSYV